MLTPIHINRDGYICQGILLTERFPKFGCEGSNQRESVYADAGSPGFYTKFNVWGSLGLNFDYEGGPIIENGGPILLYVHIIGFVMLIIKSRYTRLKGND